MMGHHDDKVQFTDLNRLSQMNVRMDLMAKK